LKLGEFPVLTKMAVTAFPITIASAGVKLQAKPSTAPALK